MSDPRTGSRVAAAALGLALAAGSAGIATLDTHSRSARVDSGTTTTITVPGVSPTPAAAPGAGSAGGGLAPPTALLFPDPVLHPGAINADFDTAKLCDPAFRTDTVRPPTSYTNKLKVLELGDGGTIVGPSGTTYTVVGENLPGAVGDYELDHLISLEIGGNPEDPKNLWMEPWEKKGARFAPVTQGAESKDVVEGRLHRAVCGGTITLAIAQAEVAANWETAK